MTIAFSCGCGTTIKVPEEMKGKKGKCPKCGVSLVVPAGDAVPTPAKKSSETFALASRDLTESNPMAVSGEVTESQVDDEPSPLALAPPKPTAARATPPAGRKAPVMRFKCPHCQKTLTVPLKLAGETGRCAGCQQRFTAPIPEQVKQIRAKILEKRGGTSLRDTFSVVKVRCQCGMTSAIPRGRSADSAKCPACDRLLPLDLAVAGEDSL